MQFKKIGLALAFALALSSQVVKGQSVLMKNAGNHFENMSYMKAIELYEDALSRKGISDQDKVLALKNLGESYLKIKDGNNAERVLRTLMSSGLDLGKDKAPLLLSYAKVLATNSKYKESQEQFDKYSQIVTNDDKAKGFSKLYNDISVLSKNADCYKVEYLSINTTASEFSPTKYQNGLIFVSNRNVNNALRRVFEWNNTPFLDLYYLDDVSKISSTEAGLGGGTAQKKSRKLPMAGNDEYTYPTANDSKTLGVYGGGNIGRGYGYGSKAVTESDRLNKSINSKYHEGPATFSKDGSKVIFTRNNMKGNSARKSEDGIVKLKLFQAESDLGGWNNIRELPFNSDEFSTGHPSLSPDEKLLFFASDMPGGFGGTDIYVSKFDGSNWGAPVNLGDKINTSGNEMFPFVDEKGNLYFSSNGHPGLGDLDVFYTQLERTTQRGKIINLGAPINSNKDDFGIITDGLRKSGYFSSNRKEGGNDDDIYKFERSCEISDGCELLIAVYDANTKQPIKNAKVKFKDSKGETHELETDAEGIIHLDSIQEDFEYQFSASKASYTTNTVSFFTDECDNEASRLEIPLDKPKENDELITKIPSEKSPSLLNPNAKKCLVKGKVEYLGSAKIASGVTVKVVNECDGSEIIVVSDKAGNFEFTGVEGCDYTLSGTIAAYGSQKTVVSKLNCDDVNNPKVVLFKEGDVVEVENIYFDYGKYNIRKDARIRLDKLVEVMREYPNMKIELYSHTDSRSSAEFNQTLSDNRAKSTAEYLFKRGISRSRILEYKGFGETQLVNGCSDGVKCSEAEHQKNRRTEIKIMQLN